MFGRETTVAHTTAELRLGEIWIYCGLSHSSTYDMRNAHIVPSIVKELVASESVTLPRWSDRMSPVTFVELLVEVASVTAGFFVLSSVVMSSCSIMGRRRWQETNKEMHFKFRGHSQDTSHRRG